MVLFIDQALPFWNIQNGKLVITTGFVETRTWLMMVVARYQTHFSQIVDILEQLLFRDM
jgi:hypothetical protein